MANYLKRIWWLFAVAALAVVGAAALAGRQERRALASGGVSDLRTSLTIAGGITIVPLGRGFMATNPTRSVANGDSCNTSLDCTPGLHCTADDNMQLMYLQAALPIASRVGRCLDTAGVQDAAPAIQADLDRLPLQDSSGFITSGLPYFLPAGAKLALNSPAGWPAESMTATNCSMTAASKTLTCASKPFRSIDVQLTMTISNAGTAGGALVTTMSSGDATEPQNGSIAFMRDAAVTTTTTATVTWTRRRIGLYAHRRVMWDGQGALWIVDTSALEVGVAILDEQIGDPNRSTPKQPQRALLRNMRMRPKTLPSGTLPTWTTWGYWLSAGGLFMEHMYTNAMGRGYSVMTSNEVFNGNAHTWTDVVALACNIGVLVTGPDYNAEVWNNVQAYSCGIGIVDHGQIGGTHVGDHVEGSGAAVGNATDLDPAYNGRSSSLDIDTGSQATWAGGYLEGSDPAPDLLTDALADRSGNALSGTCFFGGGVSSRVPDTQICNFTGTKGRFRFRNSTSNVNAGLSWTIPDSSDGGISFTDTGTAHGDAAPETFGYLWTKLNGKWGIKPVAETKLRWAIEPNNFRGLRSQNASVAQVWGYPVPNHGNITTLTTLAQTATVTSANPGDAILCSPTAALSDTRLAFTSAYVSAQDTVTFSMSNLGATLDPPAATIACRGGTGQATLRTTVNITPGSIGARDHLETTATFLGVRPNDVVWCSQRGAFSSTALAYSYARVSAADTIAVDIANMSAGAVTPSAIDMDCYGGGGQNAVMTVGASVNHTNITAGTVLEMTTSLSGLQAVDVVTCSPRTAVPANLIVTRQRGGGNLVNIGLGDMSASDVDPPAILWDCKGFTF